jgi:hypothetical protein
MAKDSRRKASAGATAQSVPSEVVACLAAHTGLPQADFRDKRRIKRFAAGGKRRVALVRALLAWPALKQLGLRQQDFDKAELSGKSTVGDIIDIVGAAARSAKTSKPPAKKKAAKTRARTTSSVTTRRQAKAPKKAKAARKTKKVAPSKSSKKVARKVVKKIATTSKAPKKAARKAAPRRTDAVAAPTSAPSGPMGRRAPKRMTVSKPRLAEDVEAANRTNVPSFKRAPRAPRAAPVLSSVGVADSAGPSGIPGPAEMVSDANVLADDRSDRAVEPPSHYANVLLRDTDKDDKLGPSMN